MNTKPPKNPLHGWLAIDKPAGMSSGQVVGRLKRALRPTKIGHAGTLDPMATGCLPIALGEATKTVQFCMDKQKTYQFTLQFGTSTTTDDKEGEVVKTSDVRPTREQIEAILPKFTGTIIQTPPAYAAIKIDGERAYKRARRGEEVEMPERQVEVVELTLLEVMYEANGLVEGLGSPDDRHEAESSEACGILSAAKVQATCSKGTYIRSLGRDIAEALDTKGHLTMLRRLRVGDFSEKALISLDFFDSLVYEHASGSIPDWLLPPDTPLDDIPVVQVDEAKADAILHGMSVEGASDAPLVRVKHNDILLAIATCNGKLLQPKRVFNLNQ